MSRNRSICLAGNDVRHEIIRSRVPAETPWICLQGDFRIAQRWERALGAQYPRLSVGPRLQAVAAKLRQPFLDWLNQAGETEPPLVWWSSRLAECNTHLPTLFDQVCYLQLALDLVAEHPDILIFSDSAALLDSCRDVIHNADVTRLDGEPESSLTERLVGSWARYLPHAIKQIIMARLWAPKLDDSLRGTGDRPRVLLHTCIDDSHFGEDGTGRDRYFGDLPHWLEANGFEVVVLPWVNNARRGWRSIYRWFRNARLKYVMPERYYSLLDYLWAAGIVRRQRDLLPGRHELAGLDITRLVRHMCRRSTSEMPITRPVLYYRLIEKFARRGFKFDFYIDVHTNFLQEKPQVIALNEFMPATKTIGFVHYMAPPPLFLSAYAHTNRSGTVPFPQRIVCNSAWFKELLERHGYAPERLTVGPSLRFPHLAGAKPVTNGNADRNAVLVIMPLELTAAYEMIVKLITAFRSESELLLLIKPHPMTNFPQFLETHELGSLPACMKVVDGNLDTWLSRVGCAIVMASTAALETALAGVPVVVVGRETALDMNPLGWFPEQPQPVVQADEINTAIHDIVRDHDRARGKARAWARQHLPQLVSPINDETMQSFVT